MNCVKYILYFRLRHELENKANYSRGGSIASRISLKHLPADVLYIKLELYKLVSGDGYGAASTLIHFR